MVCVFQEIDGHPVGVGLGERLCPGEFGGDVRIDKSGNVWMADIFENRIIEFARGTGFSNGQGAALVLGQTDFSSHACNVTQSGLCFPGGLLFDTKGRLFEAEEASCRVLEYKPKKK